MRRRLADTRASITHKFNIGGHEGYLTVGLYEDGMPGELFITMAKEGSTIGGLMDSLGTAVSVALQYGVPVESLVNKFTHQRFEPAGITANRDIPFAKSLVDYIFRWMGMEFIPGYREANAPRRPGAEGQQSSTMSRQDADDHIGSRVRFTTDAADDAALSRGLTGPASGADAGDAHDGLEDQDSWSPSGHAADGRDALATTPEAHAPHVAIAPRADRVMTGPRSSGPAPTASPARAALRTPAQAPNGAGMSGGGGGGTGSVAQPSAATPVVSALSMAMRNNQEDAPACDSCGSITVRSGTCYKCMNCGASMGCS